MQLKLTWRISGQNRDLNLLVSEEQKIKETLQVLVERGLVPAETADSVSYVRALRTNHQVNILLTYKEGNIYFGDILQIERDEPKENKGEAIKILPYTGGER